MSMSKTAQTTLDGKQVTETVPEDYEGQLGNGEDIPTVIESDGDEERCPYCGQWYSQINSHWNQSECQYPSISPYKIELIKGMVLGDGSMHTNVGNFRAYNTNKMFLEWLDKELGWLTSGVSMMQTAVKSARTTRESFGGETQPEDSLDIYCLRSRTHPQLQ